VRLDRANRNFLVLLGVALVPYALVALVGCGLLSVIVVRLFDHGLGFLTAGPGDLRAAAVVLAIVLIGTVRAIFSFVDQYQATRRLAARVRELRLPLPPALEDVTSRVWLGSRVRLVDADEEFSFTYGLTHPRVAVSRGLLQAVTAQQLEAVLVHERYHVRNLDPLKVVLSRVLSSAYFFLPALGGLRQRYSAASELAADRKAIRACGRSSLAGALHRVVRGPAWSELSTAAAIGGPELLELRVEQLERSEEPPISPVTSGAVILTTVPLVIFIAVVIGTIAGIGGPSAMSRDMMGDQSNGMGMSFTDTLAGIAPWVFLALVVALAWLRTRHRSA